MKIIGIETSSIQGGVAVLEIKRCAGNKSNYNRLTSPARPGDWSGGNESIILLKQLLLKKGLVHGKLLIPALERLLKRVHWGHDDIDLVAVDIGPGSYTGLRIGLAIAKTIAYIIKSKIAGVSSLDIMVANIPRENNYEYICPVIDARWNQVYTSIYKKDETNNILKYKRISDYLAITPSDLIKLLKRYTNKADDPQGHPVGDKLLLFGDGLKPYNELFSKSGKRIILGTEAQWFPKACNVALLGYESFKQRRYDDPIKLIPLYLRHTEAEINLKGNIR
ncbi:MAG: tRNA (adenosine(37)-N6)-threonylcarbamoyltransferase complex dimerization subunit type 1 TsaB [Planctomycetota bacterium]